MCGGGCCRGKLGLMTGLVIKISSKWGLQLRNHYSLLEDVESEREKGEGNLRFGRHVVSVSDIAEQFFCEKKVEMQYLHGGIETEEKTLGTEAHENLLADSVKIRRERLFEKIYQEKPVLALEFHLLARRKGITVAGRADSILFRKGFPLILSEYKFSKSGIAYKSHHVQAMSYCILLNWMGFDTSRLFYALVIAEQSARGDKEFKQKVIRAVSENGPKEAKLVIGNAGIQLHRFKQEEAERDTDWALEFWRKTREAIPTKNPRKCRTCEYAEKCEIPSPIAEP